MWWLWGCWPGFGPLPVFACLFMVAVSSCASSCVSLHTSCLSFCSCRLAMPRKETLGSPAHVVFFTISWGLCLRNVYIYIFKFCSHACHDDSRVNKTWFRQTNRRAEANSLPPRPTFVRSRRGFTPTVHPTKVPNTEKSRGMLQVQGGPAIACSCRYWSWKDRNQKPS